MIDNLITLILLLPYVIVMGYINALLLSDVFDILKEQCEKRKKEMAEQHEECNWTSEGEDDEIKDADIKH
jgi:hypothetical protein